MDLAQLATDLRDAFPTAPISTPLAVLGEGFGSLVVETAGGTVFRIAKHAEARHGHQRERRVLPVVRRAVSGLRVPRVIHSLDPSTAFPFGVIGYEKLPGRPLTPFDLNQASYALLAGQVAAWLTAFHKTDLGELHDADLPVFPPPRERLVDLWRNVSPYLARHLTRSEHDRVQRRLDDLLDYGRKYPYAAALIHGDLWYENLLFDEERRRLVGVIDFENVAIGDAAIDLATQRYLGDRFARAVIDAYDRDRLPSDLTERIDDLLGLRELLGLEHGLVTGDVDEDALGKVKEAILSH